MGSAVDKIACVAIVKNEEQQIAEWLAWQFHLGFDTVLLLDNASTDGTARVARDFAPLLDVRVVDCPPAPGHLQNAGYATAMRTLAGEFAWVAAFDTDEFLVLDAGLDLKSCLASRPEAAVAVSWAIFGSSGHREKPAGLIIENFLHRASPDFQPCSHVKSIVRPERVIQVVNTHYFEVDGSYATITGVPVVWAKPGRLLAPDYSGARLHRYFTRSWSHWLIRWTATPSVSSVEPRRSFTPTTATRFLMTLSGATRQRLRP